MTNSIVRSRIDSTVKAQAKQILDSMGITVSEAIRLFLHQTVAQKSIPFNINSPNSLTMDAIAEVENYKSKKLKNTSITQLSKDWDLNACDK